MTVLKEVTSVASLLEFYDLQLAKMLSNKVQHSTELSQLQRELPERKSQLKQAEASFKESVKELEKASNRLKSTGCKNIDLKFDLAVTKIVKEKETEQLAQVWQNCISIVNLTEKQIEAQTNYLNHISEQIEFYTRGKQEILENWDSLTPEEQNTLNQNIKAQWASKHHKPKNEIRNISETKLTSSDSFTLDFVDDSFGIKSMFS